MFFFTEGEQIIRASCAYRLAPNWFPKSAISLALPILIVPLWASGSARFFAPIYGPKFGSIGRSHIYIYIYKDISHSSSVYGTSMRGGERRYVPPFPGVYRFPFVRVCVLCIFARRAAFEVLSYRNLSAEQKKLNIIYESPPTSSLLVSLKNVRTGVQQKAVCLLEASQLGLAWPGPAWVVSASLGPIQLGSILARPSPHRFRLAPFCQIPRSSSNHLNIWKMCLE